MAIKTSGTLSYLEVLAEFGQDSDTPMSALYRGAGIVPTSRTVNVSGTRTTLWTPFNGSVNADGSIDAGSSWFWADVFNAGDILTSTYLTFPLRTGNGGVINGTYFGVSAPIEVRGSQQFRKGSPFKEVADESGGGYTVFNTMSYRTSEFFSRQDTVNINTNVPSSGTMSLSNFYGATNS